MAKINNFHGDVRFQMVASITPNQEILSNRCHSVDVSASISYDLYQLIMDNDPKAEKLILDALFNRFGEININL